MKRVVCLFLAVVLCGVLVGNVFAQEPGWSVRLTDTIPPWGTYEAMGFYMREEGLLEFDPNAGHSFIIRETMFVADFDGDGRLLFSTLGDEDGWVTYTDHGIEMFWGEYKGKIFHDEENGVTGFVLRFPDKNYYVYVLNRVGD